jgi:hypothetical protein
MNAGLVDIGRFGPEDADALVEASLSCPYCLRSDTIDWTLWLEEYDPHVRCRCSECRRRWRVYLLPEQALRLSLLPRHAPQPAR